MIIRTVIAAALSVYALYLCMVHNLHMFQLNGYKNDEHIRWLKKNIRQQWLPVFGLFLGLIRLCFPLLFLDILLYLTLIMEILVYRAIRRLNNKKPLKFTPRVKRLIVTDIILTALIFALALKAFGFPSVTGLCIISVSLQLILCIIANVINHPVEAGINRHYINDAKRRLKAMPQLKIIGVTGSYGKTSVKYYLETLLKSKYDVLATPGNFNTPLGITITIREKLKASHEIFICEMGARRVGEIKEICGLFPPDHGVITAVGAQHLETFHSIENIIDTKFELADAVSGKGMLFLNGDNELISERSKKYPAPIMYHGSSEGEGYRAENISVSNTGTSFTVVTPDGRREDFRVRLLGAHNIVNVVGAIAVADKMGIPLNELKIPARRIEAVPHRLQIKDGKAATIIDDAYNSNPAGSKAAVEALSMFEGIRILVTPGMVELGEKEDEYNRKFGTYAADCCDYILLVGRKHTKPIMEGAYEKGFPENKLKQFDRLEDALSYAYGLKDEGHKYILLENDLPDNY